jgi:septal ring factor EnvC (AmiA/AmiB activator)
MATSGAAFSANDAMVRTEDRATELQKARAAVTYFEREVARYPELLERLQAKLKKTKEFVTEVETQIDEAQAAEQAANAELQAAYETVESLTGE